MYRSTRQLLLCHQSYGQMLCRGAKTSASVSPLSALRRKTGFAISLCKQALEQHNNDVNLAEKWLQEQALAKGWAKAAKLDHRRACQGLIGLAVDKKRAAMVELNCETDFVARGSSFHTLLNAITWTQLKHADKCDLGLTFMDNSALSNLIEEESGHKLGDLVALQVGLLGEKLVLQRGVIVKGEDSLSGVTHPSASINALKNNDGKGMPVVQYGRYGAVLSYHDTDKIGNEIKDSTEIMARKVAQHVIGMNPLSVGEMDKYVPPDRSQDEEDKVEKNEKRNNDEEEEEDNDDDDDDDDDEQRRRAAHTDLIKQDFLLDNEVTVGEVLLQSGMRVDNFVRFELGEHEERNGDADSQ